MNKKYLKLINDIREAEGHVKACCWKLAEEIIKDKIDFSDFEPDRYFNAPPDLRVEILSGDELSVSDNMDNANYIEDFINHKGKITYKEYKEKFLTGYL